MKNKWRIFFALVLAGVVVATLFCLKKCNTASESVKAPQYGMFEWTEETVYDPESTLDIVENLNISKWYQEMPEEWDNDAAADFVEFMAEENVQVYALIGSVDWGFESDGASLTEALDDIAEYNDSVSKKQKLCGVMIDVEPYVTSKFKADSEKYMKVYVDGMIKAYESVKKQGFSVIICIPRHYDDKGLSEELERLIANGCDEVAVMDYDCGNEADKIKTEANLCQKYGKELHCILEFQEVGKHGLTEEKTYRNKGLDAAVKAWDQVSGAYGDMNIVRDYHWSKPITDMLEEQREN